MGQRPHAGQCDLSRASSAAALVLLACGCFHDDVPDGAQLSCQRDLDCPPGMTCRTRVHTCARMQGLDTTPPALSGLAGITPEAVRAGQPVAISFDVTEGLFADPVVLVGGESATLDEAGTARSERRYRFVFTPDGSEPQDKSAAVSVALLDLAGNEAKDLIAGSVRFDFAAPAPAGTPELRLFAPPRSLVDPVSALAVGGTVRVTLAFDEPLGGYPVLEAVAASASDPPLPEEVLAFDLRFAGTSASYTFEHTLAAPESGERPQGRYVLRVTAGDAVGNQAASTLATVSFEVDTVAPASPDVAAAGRVVFRREPWGSDAGGGARRMSLRAGAGAVGAGDAVVVFARDPHGELGRAVADGEGAAQVPLVWAEQPRVYVQAVDPAGNASDEVGVRDVEVVATMAGKVAGSDVENPHQFVSRAWMGHHVLGRLGPVHGATPQDGAALARIDACAAAASPDAGLAAPTTVRQAGEPAWRQRDPRRWPRFRCSLGEVSVGGAVAAYDLAREQAVAYAGDGLTWLFDGQGFRPVATVDPEGDGDPQPRCGSSLIYDEGRGEVLLVGGMGGAGETWAWNGSSWRRVALGVGAGPSPRSFAALAYDRAHRQVVLFGGSPLLDGSFDDTWVWDGRRWTAKAPAHVPPKRYGAGMSWDPATGSVVMFGGIHTWADQNGSFADAVADFWRWDGEDWTEIKPASGAAPWPRPRTMGAMLHDTVRSRVLVFGGATNDRFPDADLLLWEWDGAGWTSRAATPTPLDMTAGHPNVEQGRGVFASFHDPYRDRVVLFGGYLRPLDGDLETSVAVDDLWEYDPVAPQWHDVTPARDLASGVAPVPAPRLGASMVYDQQGQRMLLFGGADNLQTRNFIFGTPQDDLWTWDGRGWTQLPKTAPWPSARASQGMVYDPATGATLVFGGWSSVPSCDTWELSGDAWSLKAGFHQPCMTTAMTALDRAGTRQVMHFGGFAINLAAPTVVSRSNLTEVWTGAAWSPAAPTHSPYHRQMAGLAPDGLGGAILFGGEGTGGLIPEPEPFNGPALNDTWRWDGADWTLVQQAVLAPPPADRPSPRFGHSMVYDPDRGRIFLTDGWGSGPTVDSWDFVPADSRWVQRFPINLDDALTPAPAAARSAAYDTDRKRLVYFGGQTSAQSSDQLWELDMGLGQRPGHLFEVSLPQTDLPAEASLTGVEVRAVAGGRGSGAVDGVELWGWFPEGWQTLGEEPGAPPEAPAEISATVDDDARLSRIRFRDALHFALVPRGVNAAEAAVVVTDYVEATVRYRLP